MMRAGVIVWDQIVGAGKTHEAEPAGVEHT
jgi:hypothetical protein